VDEASVRVRLEGRAELLEATRLRYRALVNALASWRWRARLRKNAQLLQEVVRVQDEVDEALGSVLKRARIEGWADGLFVMRHRAEVELLRTDLLALVSKRLGRELPSDALRPGIEALETEVLTAPRIVLPGQRWSTALEVLPPNTPELRRAVGFARKAELLFGRPSQGPARLPMSIDELDDFIESWPDGVASLEAVWQRLVRIDATGSLVRFLRKRARRTLTTPPKSGPELLLYSEFWRTMAVARMDQLINDVLSPVSWKEPERFTVLRWLWHREHNLTLALGLDGGARDALIELAATLSQLPRSLDRAPLVLGGLIPVARQADRLRDTDDWKRVHDELSLLVRVVWAPKRQRIPETHGSLEELVRVLRDAG